MFSPMVWTKFFVYRKPGVCYHQSGPYSGCNEVTETNEDSFAAPMLPKLKL